VSNELKEYNLLQIMTTDPIQATVDEVVRVATGPYPPRHQENFWKELFKLIILSLVIVVPFRLYIAQPFVVDGASMDPTFKDGQYLIVDELSFQIREPHRGEVLIFKYPKDPSKYFIKRVIGLPHEGVSIKDGIVTIMNAEHPEGLKLNEPYVKYAKEDTSTTTLGAGEYFVLGDNRAQSADSRFWGTVPEANIIGRPLLRILPPSYLPGEREYQSANNQNP
jgi:signal peptidase I